MKDMANLLNQIRKEAEKTRDKAIKTSNNIMSRKTQRKQQNDILKYLSK